jgi:hypothetical protein
VKLRRLILEKSRLLVKAIHRERRLPIQVPQMQSVFHPRAQRKAFRRRDVHRQSRSFALRGRKLACQLAVFSGKLPSMEAEVRLQVAA